MNVRRCLTALATTAVSAAALATVAVSAASPAGAAPLAHPKPGNPAPSYNGLALAPPMGWNDWSYYQCTIDENLIVDQAKALVSTGLAAAGYDTVTTDDCWMAQTRAADGSLQADPDKFPHGMAWLGEQIHALGLKFGIYEDEGTHTCGGYPGSWGHEVQDANTFADWKVDYVKLDGCNVPDVPSESTVDTYKKAYDTFSAALVATGRDIVFSNSTPAYFQGGPDWYQSIENSTHNSNLWREGTDVVLAQGSNKWASILNNYSYNVPLGRYAGPGHWNDPDFLIAGDDGLSNDEIQSQMSLWAEMAAPLISSTDLTHLSPAALAVLSNRDVIAVDQDKAGVQGSIVAQTADYDVLAKPLSNGDVSVVLFNKSSAGRTISTTAGTVGLSGGPYQLRNLVTKARTASTGVIAASVPPHGTVMYRVSRHAKAALPPAVSLDVRSPKLTKQLSAPVTVTVSNDGPSAVTGATASLTVPDGWTLSPATVTLGAIDPGSSRTATFRVTRTEAGPGTTTGAVRASVSYTSDSRRATVTGEYDAVITVPYASLAAAYDNVGVTSLDDVGPGDFDGDGNSFSAEQLAQAGVTPGAQITAGGATFTWPTAAPGQPDNVGGSGATFTFTGHGSKLAFLGSGIGDDAGTVTVTYTDGTTDTGSLGFPNWSFSDPTEFGSVLAVSTQGRNTQAGYADSQYAYRLFYNSIAINPDKTIATVTLPDNGNAHVFAVATQ